MTQAPCATAMPSTDVAGLCLEHLAWAKGVLRRRFGPDAEEHAGAGLFQAANTYDPSRNDSFRAWAAQVLVWTAKRGYQREQRGAAPGESWELQDSDVEASTMPAISIGLEHREQMHQCLRRIDQMESPARWVILLRFVADADNTEIASMLGRHVSTVPRMIRGLRDRLADDADLDEVLGDGDGRISADGTGSLIFESLDDLADAAMLFGGQLVPSSGSSRLTRLALGRTRSRWPGLGWAVIILERNGLRLRPTIGGDLLIYRTAGTPLLAGSWRRWYSGKSGKRQIPQDMILDERRLTFWLAASMARSRTGPVRLAEPPMSVATAKAMARQVSALLDVNAAVVEGRAGHAIEMADESRPRLEAFLKPRAPQRVWADATPC